MLYAIQKYLYFMFFSIIRYIIENWVWVWSICIWPELELLPLRSARCKAFLHHWRAEASSSSHPQQTCHSADIEVLLPV